MTRIQGTKPVVSERPTCATCDKPLRPRFHINFNPQQPDQRQSYAGTYSWQGYPPFCTLVCALAFARAAYRSGVRCRLKKEGA